MNPNIKKLSVIAGKPTRLILGLMSGTSLDGLDVVLCSFEGSGTATRVTVLQFETVAYTEDFKKEVRTVFAKKNIDLEKLCLLNPWIAQQQAGIISGCLKKWDVPATTIDLIGSHGQTIYHSPERLHQNKKFGNATLQIGDGDQLAVTTGIITVSDFRQKHIAAGGEGAPLAMYGDYLLFYKKGEDRILLNIGGIANFTFLPGSKDGQPIISSDTGPGNTLMDAFVRANFPNKNFDQDGELAGLGKINEPLLTALKDHSFFREGFPTTCGPELFNLHYLAAAQEQSNTKTIAIHDVVATLNKFSADMIIAAIRCCVADTSHLIFLCSGGGIYNKVLMAYLKEAFPACSFETTNQLGINPDAKEAVLFALLANESICGDHFLINNGNKQMPALSMGKISFPV